MDSFEVERIRGNAQFRQYAQTRAVNGWTYFPHKDWMGSDRARTNPSGSVVATFSQLPFGDGGTANITDQYAAWDFQGFGDLDHNTDWNTDHAQFRQYSPWNGLWMSPDAYGGSYDFTNPQSLNRYSYVLNSPLSFIDALGLTPGFCQTIWVGPSGSIAAGTQPAPCGGSDTSMSSYWWDFGGGGEGVAGVPLIFEGGSHVGGGGGGAGTGSSTGQPLSIDPDQQRIQQLAQAISGEAGWVGTWRGPTYFYGASLLGGLIAEPLISEGEILSISGGDPLPPGWNENWTQMYGTRGNLNWFDEQGGEWNLHSTDSWHDTMHWNYNPWTGWNSSWLNVTLSGQTFLPF